jgi:hypothetical protein
MDEIKVARLELKARLIYEWPGTRCACGETGATDLGHIVYTRHPDSVELYDERNMVLLCNKCNTTGERLWINVNACLILLQRAGGVEKWEEWAKTIPRKGGYWIPNKMQIAMALWENGTRPFEFDKIHAVLGPPNGR